jgi:NADH:ubiquinone oxidoreductase subunit 5 (subunit L)/multisubunit Na+/H+ antiporter MnhA subunit
MGDIILSLSHSQDIRFLSAGMVFTPFSCSTIFVSVLNLLGVSSMRGFFSKDLVLESLNYVSVGFVPLFLVYSSIFFTYFYTYRLVYYSFSSNKVSVFCLLQVASSVHVFLLFLLSVISIIFGGVFMSHISQDLVFYSLFSLKFYPFLLNSLVFLFMFLFLRLPQINSVYLNLYFSRILFLSTIFIRISSHVYLSVVSLIRSSMEVGLLNSVINKSVSTVSINCSKAMYFISMFPVLLNVFFRLFFIFTSLAMI